MNFFLYNIITIKKICYLKKKLPMQILELKVIVKIHLSSLLRDLRVQAQQEPVAY